MILSDTFHFTYAAAEAWLTIVRNNGDCWAEVRTASGERLSVSAPEDQYERTDEDAAEAFIAAAQDPQNVTSSAMDNSIIAAAREGA